MKNFKNKLFYIYSLIFYIFLILIFSILSDKFIKPSANSFLLSNITSNVYQSTDIIEIVVDDDTIQQYNWRNDSSKTLSKELLDYFQTYAKPKVIGLDIVYASLRDETIGVAHDFVNQISKMEQLVSGFFPEQDTIGDDKLFMPTFEKKYSIDVELKTNKLNKTLYTGILDFSNTLRENTRNYGSVLIQKDKNSDFIFDSVNIVKINDKFYPSLPLKMYLIANDTNRLIIDDKFVTVPKTGLKFQYRYDNGNFYTPIRFYNLIAFGEKEAGYSHLSISAYRILDTYKALKSGITPETNPQRYNPKLKDALVNPEIFKDKIVFIGENISGPSEDVMHTPIDHRHPGVDIQASVYDNLDSDMTMRYASNGFNFILYALLCLSAFVVIMRQRFIKGLVCLLIIDSIYMLVVCILAFLGTLTSYATPIICQFVTAIFAYTFKFLNESRNKEQIKNAMGKYISQDVMKNVVKNIENLGLGGKRAIVTVLFSDIRGFTSMSEKMSAEDVSMILNEYFAQMEPIIQKYNGVINKFIGDAIMVIFGEPIQDVNHPKNAVKCAYEMLKKVDYLREKWLEEGKPRFEIGVGINTGEVFIGNIGTENRMEYTAIGDSVNLASRIEGYNKVYKTNLLVSSSTYNYISDCADVIKIKEVQIRGKSKKMDIYEVLRIE